MTHNVLLNNGWYLVFDTDRFMAYQLDDTLLVIWNLRDSKIFKMDNVSE